ncbi:TIGR03032 family protein [Citromicrobium sp. JLT1363]|uniref:TIGR03032 family protein n=1 Tax=Citromicrobium sp. JLT1363 TaxID=517722 RepID=UPI000225EA02|nr:TIGR03032 family protein [Citromicrobium sp. JLT1363]
MTEENNAKPADAAPEGAAAADTRIELSRGFARWLGQMKCSIAFTSYQSGRLFLVGLLPDGKVSLHQQAFQRAMGIHAGRDRLYLGGLYQVWRLENTLQPNERANKAFDALYVPRNAQTTGDIDIHELAVDARGRCIFVNTKFSCLATLSPRFGFKPLWKPEFITQLAPEDRCHLNGMAMEDGYPRYVSAVSQSDVVSGWRERRHEGGVLIDVENDRIVTDQLSMPHSPRVHDGQLWALDSGRGYLIKVDRETGEKTDVAFCPGFLRGLSFAGHYAFVTVSKPRKNGFDGLALDDEIKRRDGEPWCGVLVVDTRSGSIVEFIKLVGAIEELFDVAVIRGKTCPMAVGTQSPDIQSLYSFESEIGPLRTDG